MLPAASALGSQPGGQVPPRRRKGVPRGGNGGRVAAKRRHLKELAQDPRLIPGIHNYCDRWCERCPLTSRCLVYAMEQQEDAEGPASRDIRNEAFWKRLESRLAEATEILQELVEKHGLTLDETGKQPSDDRTRPRIDDAAHHPLATAASAYADAVHEWFETAEAQFRERGRALDSQLEMGLATLDPQAEARRLGDAVEVVRWYQHQIAVKLMRAIGSAQEHEEPESGDADGSAKVALIGLDRSITAWAEILRQFPEEEDRILPTLSNLSHLRGEVERTFPGARRFVRPGFDTGECAGA